MNYHAPLKAVVVHANERHFGEQQSITESIEDAIAQLKSLPVGRSQYTKPVAQTELR
jgi:hypothetical protein